MSVAEGIESTAIRLRAQRLAADLLAIAGLSLLCLYKKLTSTPISKLVLVHLNG